MTVSQSSVKTDAQTHLPTWVAVRDHKQINIKLSAKWPSTSLPILLQLVFFEALLQAINYEMLEACASCCIVFMRLQAGNWGGACKLKISTHAQAAIAVIIFTDCEYYSNKHIGSGWQCLNLCHCLEVWPPCYIFSTLQAAWALRSWSSSCGAALVKSSKPACCAVFRYQTGRWPWQWCTSLCLGCFYLQALIQQCSQEHCFPCSSLIQEPMEDVRAACIAFQREVDADENVHIKLRVFFFFPETLMKLTLPFNLQFG